MKKRATRFTQCGPLSVSSAGNSFDVGAGDGIRTRDIHLGKVVLYQLSYSRKSNRGNHITRSTWLASQFGLPPVREKISPSRFPTLPGGCPPSTIGAGVFNFRVRDGFGWFHAAVGTKDDKY